MHLIHSVSKELLERNYHYRRLQSQHEEIEHKLEELRQTPSVDGAQVHALKRQKLHLRDQMHQLKAARVH